MDLCRIKENQYSSLQMRQYTSEFNNLYRRKSKLKKKKPISTETTSFVTSLQINNPLYCNKQCCITIQSRTRKVKLFM